VAVDLIDNAREPRHRMVAYPIAALAPAPVIASVANQQPDAPRKQQRGI
jgi:hypothetical protein